MLQHRETLLGDDPGSLSYALDFDCPIHISATGEITYAPQRIHAPECYDPESNATDAGNGWTLITSGLTGQYGYHGPWLHDSEIIAGGVARRVLEHAAEHAGGYYVSVYATYPGGRDEYDDEDEATEWDDIVEGWAIAYRPAD